MTKVFEEMHDNLRAKGALVHNITNYVTVNDCANILLACGAAPIMADAIEEVEEITSICSGLNINIGTLNTRTIDAMIAAGKKSNELGHPVLLDPVGVGASKLRTETAVKLVKEIDFTVIRGNISEIITLSKALKSDEAYQSKIQGVDADVSDKVTDDTLESSLAFISGFAKETGAVIAVTGEIDLISDGTRSCAIRNGEAMMAKVTGTGCMLSSLTTAYVCANSDMAFEGACAAVASMGLAGEIALTKMAKRSEGNASYRNYIIDAICNMRGDELASKAKVTWYGDL